MTGRSVSLPTGTVTFLRTDVEGSMALTRHLGPAWDRLNAAHLDLIRGAVADHDGLVVRTEGDALFAVFPEASAAAHAAVDAQRSLARHDWPADAPIRVRMGLHSGEAHLAGDDYGGFEVNRAARVAAVGHGGQIVASSATFGLIADALPPDTGARDLGLYLLKDVPRPERLYQLEVVGLPSEFPPLRAGRPTIGNLSPRLTTFIGRDRELAAIADLAASSRLVTITGPGGIGKSSLAVETARSIQDGFADGAWFVPLATVDEPSAVGPLVARTLGLFDGPTRSAVEALPGFLAERSVLLIIDNFEHVLESVGIVSDVLSASPRSRVIVTSRSPLHLSGEQEYPLAPLATSTPDDPAFRLFVERARSVRPGWEPGADAAAVAAICALVDGLPLGVELAAARVSLLPPTAIHDRLAARLPLPGQGTRDVPTRQRTLEAAVAWSHDLLPSALQTMFHRLAVFEGGFDLEQAGPVLIGPADGSDRAPSEGDVLDDIARLADENLLARDPTATRARFRLLVTIRSFAAGRLAADGDETIVRRRHAETYLDLALRAKNAEGTAAHPGWIDRLALDEANLRSAVAWATEAGEADLAMRLVAAQWRFWQVDGHLTEGRWLTELALGLPGAAARSTARMWAVAAAGNIAYWQADTVAARSRYDEQLELARALDDERGIADALFNRGHVLFIDRSDSAEHQAALDEMKHRYRDLDDARGFARVRWAEGQASFVAGHTSEAIAIFEESLERFATLGDAQYHAMSAGSMAWATLAAGDPMASMRWAVQALQESYAQRDLGTTAISLPFAALVAVYTGHATKGALITAAFDAAVERYGVRLPVALVQRFAMTQDPFQLVRDALSAEEFEVAYAEGRRMSLGEAVDLVTSIAADAQSTQ